MAKKKQLDTSIDQLEKMLESKHTAEMPLLSEMDKTDAPIAVKEDTEVGKELKPAI